MTSVVVTPDAAPGPGARTSRGAGQLGGALVYIELWKAFGWLGADTWTAEEAAQRWPAIMAAVTFTIIVAHNLLNWWTTRDRTVTTPSVTVTGEAAKTTTAKK